MTTFSVTNLGDSGPGTLRDAITMSNASTTALPNDIDFSQLPGNPNTISLMSPLPQITASVTIDGTSAPGYDASKPAPTLLIDGIRASTGAIFDVATDNVVIRSIDIENFNVSAVTLESGNNDVVAGCYVGIDLTGSRAGTNTGTGILVSTDNATIGGTTPADRNVIAGVNQGVQFTATSSFNTIEGNYIGTNSQGTAALGTTNKGNGIELDAGFILISDNLVSGYAFGIQVLNDASFATISGNYIGTDFSGNKKIGNQFDGLYINATSFTTVGVFENATDTGLSGAPNVISGNGRDGVQLTGFSPFDTFEGNLIGIGADKSTNVGNGFYGIFFNGGGGSSTIGGAERDTATPNEVSLEAAMGNTIAFNGSKSPVASPAGGVLITGSQTGDGVLSNSIFSNAGPGIQINGSNNGVLPPTINSALSGGGETKVSGTLFENQRNDFYRIQLFYTSTAGNGEGKTLLGDFDVQTDSLGNANFTQILTPSAPIGSYLTATATEGVPFINNSSIFSTPVQIGQAVVADLAVTIAATATDPATPLVGQPYVYAVTVTNNPNNASNIDDATGVVLTDTLPANATLVNAGTTPGATLANGVLTYDIGNLANGASTTLLISVKPGSATSKFTDSATVTSDDIDQDLTNNTATNTSTNGVLPDATLTSTITPAASPTPVGSPLNFRILVSNQGPSTANNAVVTITLDPSFTNYVVSPDQGTYSIANNVITVSTGILPSGSGSTITLTATPTAVGTFATTTSITSSIINPTTGTNTSATTTSSVKVSNSADLGIVISSPSSGLINQQLLYTLTVTNNGPSTATTPVVLDTLPPGVTFDPSASSDSSGGTLSLTNGVVTDTIPPIPAGGTDTIIIAVTPTVSGQITNSATVADPDPNNPSEIDTDSTNNAAAATTLISPADVGVTILNPTDPLFIGTQAAYQVQVYNNGPADATNVILVDTFGPGAVIASTTAGVITSPTGGQVVTANLGTIVSGGNTIITILVNPTISGPLVDSAVVMSDQIDPNSNNNNTSSSNLVSPVDLGITVTGLPTSVVVGTPVTFTVVVTNSGPATATNVQFTGIIPAGTTFVSSTPSQGAVSASGTSLTGDLGSLAPGASATVTIVLIPTSVESVTETVSVISDDFDTDTTNDSALVTVGAVNQPGVIEVATPLFLAPENAGSVTLTLNRVDGTLGAVTVVYSTFDSTALAGINYVATSGSVTFADGQTTATVTIPVIDDHLVDSSKGFYFTLLGTTGGATLDSNFVTAVVLSNVDRDTVPPVVTGFTSNLAGKSIASFTITFSEPLDPGSAFNPANYLVSLSNRDAGKGADTPITIVAAAYNSANNTVTLIPASPLSANRFYHIILNGSYGAALTDTSGNFLAGNGASEASNYEIYYGRGTSLRYIDASNNAVTVTLSGPGSEEIIRGADGNADVINLTGIKAHKTKLSGAVKKLAKTSSGHTLVGTINGLGHFGDVKSTLTTPGFYVLVPPILTTSTVSASSVTLPSVTLAKKTVKGPLTS